MENDSLPPFTVSAEYAAKLASAEAAVAATPPPTPAQPKTGFLTSEFWLHVLALIVPLVYNALAKSNDPIAMAASQAAAGLYSLARALTKTGTAKASAISTLK